MKLAEDKLHYHYFLLVKNLHKAYRDVIIQTFDGMIPTKLFVWVGLKLADIVNKLLYIFNYAWIGLKGKVLIYK